LISIKKLFGDCTRRLSLWVWASATGIGFNRSVGIDRWYLWYNFSLDFIEMGRCNNVREHRCEKRCF
jgi:hypothetical protein